MADDIVAFLELNSDKWNAGIKRAGDELHRFQADVDRSFKDLEKAAGNPFGNLAAGIASLGLDRVASQLSGVAQAIAAPFAAAGKNAIDFEAEMRNVNSVAQLSEGQFAAFSDTIADLGRELNLGIGPAESAAAAYDIVSAGFTDAADAEAILRESLRGSKAGLTESAVASDLLTTAIAAYGLKAEDAARVNDVLFQTVASGKTTYEELAQSFGQVATIAAQNGVTLEELGASIALLTQRGLKTPEAINAIKAAIVQLGSPTEEAIKAQQAFGLNINQSTIRQKGLIAVLNEVTQATKGNTTAQRQILGDVTALNAALGLTSDGGVKYVEVLGQMENASGATDKALQQQQQSLRENLKNFAAALQRAGVVATQLFLPALTKIVQIGTGVVNFVSGLPKPVLAAGAVMGLLAAGTLAVAAAGLGLVAAVGTAATGIAALGGSAALSSLAVEGLAIASVAAEVALIPLAEGIGVATVGFAAIAGAAIAAAAAFVIFTVQQEELTKINEEALQIDEARAKALRENKSLLEQSAEQIVKSGKGSKDLAKSIGGLQDQLTAARAAGNQDLIADLQQQIVDAQRLKTEVSQLETTMNGAAESATNLNSTISSGVAARKDALAEEVQAINLSAKSDREKADSLNALIGKYRLEGDERRRIETDVARLQKRALDEENKGIQTLASAQQRLLDVKIDGWKKDLAAGKDVAKQLEADIRRRTALEIDAIRQKANAELNTEADPTRRQQIQDTAAADEAAARKKGDQQVAEARKSADDLATKRSKERVDAELKQNQLAQDGIDKRLEGLQREAQLGRDNAAEQAKLIQQKADLQAAALKKAAEQNAKETKDPAAKTAILSNADSEIANVKKQTELDLQQLERDSADQKRANSARELGLVKQIKDAQIDALKQQAEQGKNVTEQLRQALLDRLAIQEQEIRLNAEAAKAATNSAEEQARIEQVAQTQIIAARVKARGEINSTIDALKKEKEARDALSGVGDTQTLEQFLQSQSDQFGIGATRKRIQQQVSANRSGAVGSNLSGITARAQDVLDATKISPLPSLSTVKSLTSTPDQASTLASKQQAQADAAARANLRATQSAPGGGPALGRVEVLVGVDPNNGQIEIESVKPDTTANGKGSKLEIVAGGLSPRNNVGGA